MKKTNEQMLVLAKNAAAGDKAALETLVAEVQDLVFNVSLRMLGTFADAEDAAQDILLKVITHLSQFRGESAFTTWVFSIAVNHLKTYKKHLFAKVPLSFEYYGNDIETADIQNVPDLSQDVEKSVLAEELKLSCTNVMLQCLDVESRCVFILGTMFRLDSRIAGEILGMTAEAYRQKLSRSHKKMADFLGRYCGEYGGGKCRCKNRVNYAIQNRRLNPTQQDFTSAEEIPVQTMLDVKTAMEDIDDLSQDFSFCKAYRSPARLKRLAEELLHSAPFSVVRNA